MEIYGYVRVSTKDQNPERQIIALQEQKIDKQNIHYNIMNKPELKIENIIKRMREDE